MNKLETTWVNINRTQDRVSLYIKEIKEIIRQIKLWEDIRTCKCSYYPLRETVEMAINWELWEKYRGLVYTKNDDTIRKLALMINNRHYN